MFSREQCISKRTVATFLILLFLLSGLFAKGAQDTDLHSVDDLIGRREYNGALEAISEYLAENPEDFDNTELRIRSIFGVRDEYMELADELLYVLENEPENDEKKLEIISQLESMEKNPSLATKNFITQAKAAAEFTYYRAQFEKLIAKGAEETRNGEYLAALNTDAEGFALYYTGFKESGYDESFVQAVDAALDHVRDAVKKYEDIQFSVQSSYDAYVNAVSSGNLLWITTALESFSSQMTEFSRIRNTIADNGRFLRDQFALLKAENPDLTEASFLPFAYRFVLGRASTADSGMLAALDTHWASMLESLKPEMMALLSSRFGDLVAMLTDTGAEKAVSLKNAADTSIEQVRTLITLADSLNGLYSLLSDEETDSAQEDDSFETCLAVISQVTEGISLQLGTCVKYMAAVQERDSQTLPEKMAEAISASDLTGPQKLISIAGTFSEIAAEARQNEDAASARQADLAVADSVLGGADVCRKGAENLSALCSGVYTACDRSSSTIWLTLADSILQADRSITSGYVAVWENAEYMLNRNLDTDIPSRPQDVIPLIEETLVSLEKDYAAVAASKTPLDGAVVDLSSQYAGIEECLAEMSRLRNSAPELISLSNERILLSKRAENEAVLRTQQARTALKSSDFESARESLQKSRTKYNEALLYQDSDELRTRSDELLAALGDDILRAENEIVVRDVRKLKTQAKNAYYQSNFEQAENLLVQAKSLWETTNVDPDEEITSLMSLVGMALSIKTGRTIPVTAPLYPEMSQLLNTANSWYQQAQTLIKNGKREEAVDLLGQALQKLREVQLVYPLNQEASLLTLRIDQLIDPAAFQEYFARKVETAKSDYLDPQKRQTVYTDLLDLQEINPRYPGLSDFIYKVELALGIRVLPPDTTAIRESEALTREAQALYDSAGRNEIVLTGALTKVNEALAKNADNEEAQLLKDRINTALGGTGTTVLTAESETMYQKAIQELQKGNTLQASVIVTQLLQDPQNKKSSKILDLKKKVDSLL